MSGIPTIYSSSVSASVVTNFFTTASASNFTITLSGSTGIQESTVSASLNPTNVNYYTKTFGFSPKGENKGYVYSNFSTFQSASFATGEQVQVNTASFANIDFTNAYTAASTPYITSQKVGGNTTNLFKFHTLSHGAPTSYEFKIGIRDIKAAGTIAGSEYGSFTVLVRRVDQDKPVARKGSLLKHGRVLI